MFKTNGHQIDDINSVAEFIYQVALGNDDNAPEDEDDDCPRSFHITLPYIILKSISQSLLLKNSALTEEKEYALYKDNKWFSPVLEINTPPPNRMTFIFYFNSFRESIDC